MNGKRKNFKGKYGYFIVLIVVVVIVILSYTIKTDRKLNTFESLVKDCVVEVQKLFYTPIRNFSTMLDDFFSLKDVLEENKILKSNI